MIQKQLNYFLKLTFLIVVINLYGQNSTTLFIADDVEVLIAENTIISIKNGVIINADAIVFFTSSDDKIGNHHRKNDLVHKQKFKTLNKALFSKIATKNDVLKKSEIQVTSLPFPNPLNNTNSHLLNKQRIVPTTITIKNIKKIPELKVVSITENLINKLAFWANNKSLFTYRDFCNTFGKLTLPTRPPPYYLI